MKAFGVDENNFRIDLSIVRGLDYYTGTVYETVIRGYESLGSVCGGGRYDNLAEYYTKTKLPGIGMSIGITRLFDKLKENNMINNEKSSISKVIIIPMGDTLKESIKISNILRENNINTTLYLEDTKFKNKMQFASKSNIPYAILVGEDEVKNNYITLKNLFEFTQQQITLEEALNILK